MMRTNPTNKEMVIMAETVLDPVCGMEVRPGGLVRHHDRFHLNTSLN
jgi:hypothetical protein